MNINEQLHLTDKCNKLPTMPSSKRSSVDPEREIIEYLRALPVAEDTVNGILEWWIPDQHHEIEKIEVLRAIKDLVRLGLIEEIEQVNGSRHYRLSDRKDDGC